MSKYNVVATIRITVEDEKVKDAIFKALLPEVRVPVSSRAKVYCESVNKSLLLVFRAIDLTSLRAVVNSFLRLIYSIEGVLAVVHDR